jgi:hemerythrin-like domain-containing protein
MIGEGADRAEGREETRRHHMKNNRRGFLRAATAFGVASFASLGGPLPAAQSIKDDKNTQSAEEISAPEDLMREHGVLDRILLIYEEGMRRLQSKEEVPPDVFHKPALLVRQFIEDYHEKLEEHFIFPEFAKRNELADLVKVLQQQHQAGRSLTDMILRHAAADQFRKEESRQQVIRSCAAFIRMYRPHAAREDTVLFPTLHKIVPATQVKELGEQFETEEHRLFGEEGFEKTVEQVAAIEKQLSIYDLASFTPR